MSSTSYQVQMKFLVTGLFLVIVLPSLAQVHMSSRQASLKLTHSKEQIFVFTNPQNSDQIIEYKAHTTIANVSLEQVLAIFSEYEQHSDWVYNCKASELLKKQEDIVYLYQVCNATWPIRNRDYVLKLTKQQLDAQTIKISFSAVDKMLPEKKQLVRINHFEGYWLLQETDAGVKVSMYSEFDPLLSMPKAMRKSYATKIPYHTLRNLRAVFEQ